MLRRLQMAGRTLEKEVVADSPLLTYRVEDGIVNVPKHARDGGGSEPKLVYRGDQSNVPNS